MRVLHLIDSLQRGGAEQAAVHLSNALLSRGHQVVLCATRRGGALESECTAEVVLLGKRSALDLGAHRRLHEILASRRIEVVHAHSTSLLSARLALIGLPTPALIWHDHFGDLASGRRRWPLRLLRRRVDAAIAASRELAEWDRAQLGLTADWLPNAVPRPPAQPPLDLDGSPGKRLVCVANFRPQKDHQTLLAGLAPLLLEDPELRLFLVGRGGRESTRGQVEKQIADLDLAAQVVLLGERDDVARILSACDIGLLGSRSEGMPLTLVEYGWAELAVLATEVGQCRELLAQQRGWLVPPGDPGALETKLRELLADPGEQRRRARALHDHVRSHFDLGQVAKRLEEIYAEARTARCRAVASRPVDAG
ncbi:MAG: glycosyltransferase [Acidobacteria bacterium]|nr:MAG: glycosyltransferase [Acidobacteriota bacterium]REK12178.1 MAG: glycosyltransferase [Acidobacteriota bacterium]